MHANVLAFSGPREASHVAANLGASGEVKDDGDDDGDPRFQLGLGSAVLQRVVAHVEANLGERMSLDQLAALAGMSRYHFARQFRISTGQSPMGYVRLARIERATAILRERTMTIARVAVSLGFADQSHFTRTFGRFIGVTPKSFAERHCRPGRRTSASNMRVQGEPKDGL
jgi:AraC family transcriptional regulator